MTKADIIVSVPKRKIISHRRSEGNLTNIRPTAPNMSVVVGVVRKSHATEGEIETRVVVVQRIGLASDVYLPGRSNNSMLFWDVDDNRHEYTTSPLFENLTIENTLFTDKINSTSGNGINITDNVNMLNYVK